MQIMASIKYSVLFVCLGNICRSPMAEAVFRHYVTMRGFKDRFVIDSAGTGGWHQGEPPHEGTQRVLSKHAVSFEGQTARQLIHSDFEAFDLLIAMDRSNQRDILALACKHKVASPQVKLLLAYTGAEADVPDPYYSGEFDYTFELVSKGCTALLNELSKFTPVAR